MLIIVESPAKAKTISKIVGQKHMVKASVGHIRKLSDDKKTKDGRTLEIAGIDIDNHFLPLYEIEDSKKNVVSELKKLAKQAKEGILFATDSDREGEAISWHLAEVLGIKDKSQIKRLEFHEITQKAINEALANPREMNLHLVSAQQARQVLDKLVGFKLSPVLWNTIGNFHLSAGRVQSPALRLICEREEEIEKFVPQEYWDAQGVFHDNSIDLSKLIWIEVEKGEESGDNLDNEEQADGQNFKLIKIKSQKIPTEIGSRDEMEKLLGDIHNFPKYIIQNIQQKTLTINPKPPFTTSTLQQAASSSLGYSPKMTMQLAQKLYEGVDIAGQPTALITYMRTDSLNLSAESIQSARKYIQQNHSRSLPDKPNFYKSKSKNAQEAHEAIRPTNPELSPESIKNLLDPKLWKLYRLIWRQMIASQMKPELKTRLTFDLTNDRGDVFQGSSSWTTQLGFKEVMGEDVKTKPDFNYIEGQEFYAHEIYLKQHFTKPPARFSAASLIKKLEELGVGRPSTYASIISTLNDRGYIEDNSRQMVPTTLGRKINDLLRENFNFFTSSQLTAEMEDKLDEISRGEKTYSQVLDDFWWGFKTEVENKKTQLNDNKQKYRTSATDVLCPSCSSTMELKLGRFGEYYQCTTHKEHQFPKNFREYAQALQQAEEKYAQQAQGRKCEVCSKDIIVRVSKSSLKPYLACPDYQVGNKHSVFPISFGPCPKCAQEGRVGTKQGLLVEKKGFRGKSFVGCNLPKEVCGYIQSDKK